MQIIFLQIEFSKYLGISLQHFRQLFWNFKIVVHIDLYFSMFLMDLALLSALS